MFNKSFTLFFVLFANLIYSQVQFTKIFEKEYNQIPIKIRIDNSGIYGVSSFDVKDGVVCLNSFDDNSSYIFNNGNSEKILRSNNEIKDFTLDFKTDLQNLFANKSSLTEKSNLKFRKSYLENSPTLFLDIDGNLTGSNGENISLTVESKNNLKITSNLQNLNNNIELNFSSNLACADIIGIDKAGDVFVIVETFISEIPLNVRREVYTLSNEGSVLSILEIPSIKYIYTIKDFQIDEEGNLYHLICDKEKVSVLKYSGLTSPSKNKINYPKEYNYTLHFNDFVSTDEVETIVPNKPEANASRVEALRIGEQYVLHQYSCTSSNLVPNGVTAPDGDVVITPSWLVQGANARIPYKWGGFSSLAQFDNGLATGKYAGDINTAGVSSYSVGVDCSGFVSRCWQMTYHSATSSMPNITTQYASWNDLKPGDAIHKVGHVRLFIEKAQNGSLRVVESAGRNWDVSYWTFALSDLASYTPRYYNNMVNDYSTQQPTLNNAFANQTGGTVLNWNCDTTNVKGYKLYASSNGANWSLVKDENSLTTTSTTVSRSNNSEFYRVSSVLNNSPAFSESNWSNVLGVGVYSSNKKVLLVDGFERNTGSWRGPGNNFISRYGKALQPLTLDFESVKNNVVKDSLININNYDEIFWILGDESTADETFSTVEQNRVKNFLENGGKLFVSGSEIGWDLYQNGTAADKDFFNNYLKAIYIVDNAASNLANGVTGSCFNGVSLNFGQVYYEDYPDEIGSANGSTICMKFSNNKGAGVEYSGTFGSSSDSGKIIYLSFPLETTADDNEFNSVILKSMQYFEPAILAVDDQSIITNEFNLSQNYPNPFNPSTTIEYTIPNVTLSLSSRAETRDEGSRVQLKVYDILGNEVASLVNEEKPAGAYKVDFNASGLSSGVYFYSLKVNGVTISKSMILIK